ncbi:MAG: hypothetical protein QG597_242 [Actinomycetota bacterium]|nr:hypothetical protein [Actinomycetota bacterium]
MREDANPPSLVANLLGTSGVWARILVLKALLNNNSLMVRHRLTPLTEEALATLAASIKAARIRRRWTIRDLAERVGVSAPTILKIERGDPGVAIGTVFEAARLVGVPLFDPDDAAMLRYGALKRAELALLPSAARPPGPVDDDF